MVGSLNVDQFAYVDHLPRPGETIGSRTTRRQLGGKGFNQAVALRQLGAEVLMIGAVGDDEEGRAFEAELDRRGIDRSGLHRAGAPTGMALITVDQSGENTIVLAPGANLCLDPDRARSAGPVDAVLAQGELRGETTAAALASTPGRRVLNAAPASTDLFSAIGSTDLVIVNEGEAADLGGIEGIRQHGAKGVVVTLGSKGALVDDTVMPAPAVTAVDATGAGDAFCAALTFALVVGSALPEAARFAAAAGAAACLRPGASASMPTREEVERLLGGPGQLGGERG